MNRFIIVDGLPYLYADERAYKVRWNEDGFTVGSEVELTSEPETVYLERTILAKCAADLDSIKEVEPNENDTENDVPPEDDEQGEQDETPETDEASENDTESTETDEAPEDDEQGEQASEGFDSMTIAELKDYAAAQEINLGGARTKETIIAAITDALI